MIYFWTAVFFTGIFIIQFIISFIFGEIDFDTDIDVTGDGIGDFDLSSIFSFKGLIHFGIGFCWTMYFCQGSDINWFLAILVSILVGVAFTGILWGVYKIAMSFSHEIVPEEGLELVGRGVEIYLSTGENNYTGYTIINGCRSMINVSSSSGKKYQTGNMTELIDYSGGIYWIE